MTLAPLRLSFDVALVAVFASAGVMALGFDSQARYLPLVVTTFGCVFAVVNLVSDIVRIRAGSGAAEETRGIDSGAAVTPQTLRRTCYYSAWIFGYLALMFILGLVPATVAFLVAFLHFEAKKSWVFIAIGVAATYALLWVTAYYLGLHWPVGILS